MDPVLSLILYMGSRDNIRLPGCIETLRATDLFPAYSQLLPLLLASVLLGVSMTVKRHHMAQ